MAVRPNRTRRPARLVAATVGCMLAACFTPRPTVRNNRIVKGIRYVDVVDDYRWLEDDSIPVVRRWVDEQDAAARELLASIPMRDTLEARFRSLFYVDSVSAPVHRGGRYFYTRTTRDKEKSIVCWKEGETGEEHVLLDPNTWSKGGTVSLGIWKPSWDGRRVVFGRRENGEDESTLHVLEVDTGRESKVDVIPGAKYAQPSWTPDGSGFYYERLPVDPSIPIADRPGYTEIRFHELGTNPADDPLLHERTGDPSTFLGQSFSRDGRWLFATVMHGWNASDLWFRDLQADPIGSNAGWRPLVVGHGAIYDAIVWQGFLYILTDEGASQRHVFKASVTAPDRAHWKEIVPADPKATLQSVDVIGGRLVLSYLRDAASELRLASLDGVPLGKVPLPGIGTVDGVQGNPDEDDAFFSFSSFTTPPEVHRLSVATNASTLWAATKVPFDPGAFQVEQVFATSKDGTRVPIFLVHRKGLAKNGQQPTLLHGYGGFNITETPIFRTSIVPWVEAGGVYAHAVLRGGGEYGTAWHDAGRGAHKQNTFDDFAAAAEYLEREGWTNPSRLAINGGSNGGLLVGVAMTQHPELFRAVVCQVPLLDMVRYHLFGSGRTWIPEYGDPDKPDDLRVLLAYSPYHHVVPGTRYPALLMMSADHDDRVDPMHARKFVAAVQAAEEGEANPPLTLLRVDRQAGHHGADQMRQTVAQYADMYAFLFHELGVATPPEPVAGSSQAAP